MKNNRQSEIIRLIGGKDIDPNATYKLVRNCAASNNLSKDFATRRVEANEVMKQYFDLSY